ncbi:MAG: [FeFe] hydrogenase H-cluster radical SAM maturase HydE [Spirochaetaceae bacterium]|nr:[FeFe] hydrogenase H-cluster radical SAM maturase HydE [Spirochaetaceae bacterium]
MEKIAAADNLNNNGEIQETINYYKTATTEDLCKRAASLCETIHGKDIILRGLIEFTNYCDQDCLYCGIRKSNSNAVRYRIDEDEIIKTVATGYNAGLRTFVLQGGEDSFYTSDKICRILEQIKKITEYNASVTLSIGVKSREDYKRFKEAGADRYLIRFETSDPKLYQKIKVNSSFERRITAIRDIRELGYEAGSGYMTGLPGETEEIRINNALLCKELDLDMVGVGPFIPSNNTPLAASPQMPLEHTIRATALLRLLLPKAHIPATTAAGTVDPLGREKMVKAGANVLMPNITPVELKKHYLIYSGKICLDENGSAIINDLALRMASIDRKITFSRGTALRFL